MQKQSWVSAKLNFEDFGSVHRFLCGLEEHKLTRQRYSPFSKFVLRLTTILRHIGYISCHGQVLLHHCGWVYEIQELYVQPECRSKGIGAALVAAVEKELQNRECVLLEVASNMRRTRAHAFYEAIGFTKTSYRFAKEMPKTGHTSEEGL